jgi:bifunctional non-homologous end joining protein LigD
VAWEELDGITGANIYSIRDARTLLDRAAGKALKGWGQAKQALPEV